jgi:hypothetical protein
MENKEKMENLPEHLKGIKFESWHFYINTKAKKGENKLTISDNFIDEVMRQKNLGFIPDITKVIPLGGESGKVYVEAKVEIYDKGLYDLDTDKPGGEKTTGFASVTEMPHSGGQTHFAQLAITRALKNAVIRHLQISDHDILLVIEAYGFDVKQIAQQQTRNIVADEDSEEKEEKGPEEAEVDMKLDV